MTITRSNIPGRWLSMYKAFKKNGSNYDVVNDPVMKDAYQQLDALFNADKKVLPSTKMSTSSKSRAKKVEELTVDLITEPVVVEEKIVSKED